MRHTGANGDYVWFEDCRVVLDGLQPMCVVGDKTVPLPIIILHPDCTLAEEGDVGRLGVPCHWAKEHGLLSDGAADAPRSFDAEVAKLTASNATDSAHRARADARELATLLCEARTPWHRWRKPSRSRRTGSTLPVDAWAELRSRRPSASTRANSPGGIIGARLDGRRIEAKRAAHRRGSQRPLVAASLLSRLNGRGELRLENEDMLWLREALPLLNSRRVQLLDEPRRQSPSEAPFAHS